MPQSLTTALSLPTVFLSDTLGENTLNTGTFTEPESRLGKEEAEGGGRPSEEKEGC